jgi:hypothetical protein
MPKVRDKDEAHQPEQQTTNNKQRTLSNEHHEAKLAIVLAIEVALCTLNFEPS